MAGGAVGGFWLPTMKANLGASSRMAVAGNEGWPLRVLYLISAIKARICEGGLGFFSSSSATMLEMVEHIFY